MGETTGITWTDHTFNIVWGCHKVSDECKHCYAEAWSKRVGLKVWGQNGARRTFGEKHWHEPLKWNRDAERAGVRARVFCSSMADVFESHPTLTEERQKLWPLIGLTPWLDWQLLTKRPENMRRFAPEAWRKILARERMGRHDGRRPILGMAPR
jgi:protein gp37